jgi:hypothetical protein
VSTNKLSPASQSSSWILIYLLGAFLLADRGVRHNDCLPAGLHLSHDLPELAHSGFGGHPGPPRPGVAVVKAECPARERKGLTFGAKIAMEQSMEKEYELNTSVARMVLLPPEGWTFKSRLLSFSFLKSRKESITKILTCCFSSKVDSGGGGSGLSVNIIWGKIWKGKRKKANCNITKRHDKKDEMKLKG